MLVTTWDQEFSDEESINFLATVAREHCLDAGSSGEIIRGLIDRRDWSGLVHFEFDNNQPDSDVGNLIHLRQALGFFQKLEWLDIGIDKERAAVVKFEQGESACRETNKRLAEHASGKAFFKPDVNRVIHAATRKIAELLGDVPKLSELKYTFGPGANGSVPKRMACPRVKLGAALACSANAVGLLPSFFREVPHWSGIHTTKVAIDDEGWLYTQVEVAIMNSQLAFALKNAKTYRGVNTEPPINGVIQRGYGEFMFQKLKSVGVDLRNQDSNKQAARRGSLTGDLATLDLVNSSGLICKGAVELLFPYGWWARLSDLRSPKADYIKPDGSTVVYELECFSTMGNGYTFPLQSLIYWALVTSCCAPGEEVRIYGDDIICPTARVPLVMEVFAALGFEINTSKSFWNGPFRESCGGDYYLGIDIRPYYQKHLVSGRTLFALHNYYYRAYMFDYANLVRSYIAPDLQIFGPDGFGDGHLLSDTWEKRHHKRELGWGGYVFDTYKDVGDFHCKTLPGDAVLPVYTVYANQCEMEDSDFASRDGNIDGREERPTKGKSKTPRSLADTARSFEPAPLPLPTTVVKKDGKPVKVTTDDGRSVNKRRTLQSLPGVTGYKRISIYTLA